MSSKHTFEGLQFRIMETLEKQPNRAPLTALEIAERLHATEYRDHMKDNVVFKVAQAVHSMKDKGKIVLADARDKEGRLTYQLPQRTPFSTAKSNGEKPPANPVLTAEIAQHIKTVEPKKEPEKPTHRTKYVEGIQEMIVAELDKSPYPLTGTDLAERLGHHYVEVGMAKEPTDAKVMAAIATNLTWLSREAKRIFLRPTTVRGKKYEYFTRKTGKEENPLAGTATTKGGKYTPKSAPKSTPVAVKPQLEPPNQPAPKPSEAWPEQPKVTAPAPAPNVFRPGAKKVEIVQLNVNVPREKREEWSDAAARFGVTFNQFVIDALDFAMSHAEG